MKFSKPLVINLAVAFVFATVLSVQTAEAAARPMIFEKVDKRARRRALKNFQKVREKVVLQATCAVPANQDNLTAPSWTAHYYTPIG